MSKAARKPKLAVRQTKREPAAPPISVDRLLDIRDSLNAGRSSEALSALNELINRVEMESALARARGRPAPATWRAIHVADALISKRGVTQKTAIAAAIGNEGGVLALNRVLRTYSKWKKSLRTV
ncbi:MAG: hypothetical protein ABI900_05300 [Betaproteobacteria bacterium]